MANNSVPDTLSHSAQNLNNLLRPSKKDITNRIHIGLLNARSVKNKTGMLYDHIIDNDLDIFLFTETWLTDHDQSAIAELTPTGYSLKHIARNYRRGGGVAILYKTELSILLHEVKTTHFECLDCTIRIDSQTSIRLTIVY